MSNLAMGNRVLLDTCAFIWLVTSERLSTNALTAIISAGEGGGILVSPITAWEIGMLSNPLRKKSRLVLKPDCKEWIRTAMTKIGLKVAPLTMEIAVEASYLPGQLHGDPADRLLIATARNLGVPMITRDAKIIEYAADGWIDVVAC